MPLAGIAAYAGFDATLSLLSSDAPPPASAPVAERPLQPVQPATSDAQPLDAPPLAGVDAAEGVVPRPSPSAEARAAAAPAAKAASAAKKKAPAPREDLTEQDRRALEQVLERATEQNDAR